MRGAELEAGPPKREEASRSSECSPLHHGAWFRKYIFLFGPSGWLEAFRALEHSEASGKGGRARGDRPPLEKTASLPRACAMDSWWLLPHSGAPPACKRAAGEYAASGRRASWDPRVSTPGELEACGKSLVMNSLYMCLRMLENFLQAQSCPSHVDVHVCGCCCSMQAICRVQARQRLTGGTRPVVRPQTPKRAGPPFVPRGAVAAVQPWRPVSVRSLPGAVFFHTCW